MDIKTTDLSKINRLGPKYVDILFDYNIKSINDLVNIIPKSVKFYTSENIYTAKHDEYITFIGKIISPCINKIHNNKLRSLTFNMIIDDKIVKVIIFNRNFLQKKLIPGQTIKIYGKFNLYKCEMVASELFFDTDDHCKINYGIRGIPSNTITRFIKSALAFTTFTDDFPSYLVEKYKLININDYFKGLHFPSNQNEYYSSMRRFKYQELFNYFLKLHHYSFKSQVKRDGNKQYDIDKVKKFILTIPFELSNDQKMVVNDIFYDFKSDKYSNRLIQGDVGSGKTIVALIAAYASVTAKEQVILLAPTEILATQHFKYFQDSLLGLNVRVALLTSNVPTKAKNNIINQLETGEIDIIISTHAIVYQEINYKNLGLVIIDEQHRFGVEIRQNVKKNINCDSIYLSATPIPRSLALTYFKHLDISEIKQIRSTKKDIKTRYINYSMMEECFIKIEEELKTNHQIFIVTSLIQKDDEFELDIHDLYSAYEMISNRFCNKTIGILHGKMKKKESEEVISKFYKKEIDILISTTVIEVGVSVDSASVIVILDAERFGLSTLHQIRGRVGRVNEQGYCYLVSKSKSNKRLSIIENSTDGFYLSQMDLELRGPGGFFTENQSGKEELKYIDMKNDEKILKCSSDDAYKFIIDGQNKKNIVNERYFDKIIKQLKSINSLN